MSKLFKNSFFYSSLLAVVALGLIISSHVFGWTTPSANPPSSNLPAPINISSTEQTKAGNLIIEGVLSLGQFTTVNAPSGTEGALYFDTTENKAKVYSSAAWSDLGGGGNLWVASGTAASFDNDVYIGGSLYVKGQRVICPAGQGGTDSYCNYVCTTYYVQTGTEGALTSEYCYNKEALLSANCGAVGGCEVSDYTNCDSQSNDVQEYECGVCKYINTVNCVNNVLGSCTNYDSSTYCAYNGNDNSATNYHCSNGACLCDSSSSTLSADGKDNDCDGTKDEWACTGRASLWCVDSCPGITWNSATYCSGDSGKNPAGSEPCLCVGSQYYVCDHQNCYGSDSNWMVGCCYKLYD